MIEDVEPTVPLGRLWALTKDERGELQGLNRAGGDQPISWHQIVPSVSAYSMADPKFCRAVPFHGIEEASDESIRVPSTSKETPASLGGLLPGVSEQSANELVFE